MTAGAHEAAGGNLGPGGSVGASSARGVIVIVAAVAVGLLLMWRGLGETDSQAVDAGGTEETTSDDVSSGDDAVADGDTNAADDGTATDGATDTTPDSTAAPVAHAPAEVTVLVLNGTNGIKGVAGRGTEVAAGAGFATAEAKNADVDGPSVVLYVEGYEADAIAVAQAFSVDPAAVVQPFDPATSPIADTQGAHVIVRVGNDGLIQV
ncbi:MAG: LytR C-terminal domain-containing protein [Acidimicrobiales bacterium]